MLDLDNIKALIFDLGGVIINLDKDASIKKFKDLGVIDADKKITSYLPDGIFLKPEMGLVTNEEFFALLRHEYGINCSDEEIREAFIAILRDMPEKKRKLLRRLKRGFYNAKGERIRILLLSNTNDIDFSYIRNRYFESDGYTLSDYFDRVYLSYEVHMVKPNEDIYRYLLDNENLRPEDCLFLDDSERNINAAGQLGINTYHVAVEEDFTPLFEKIG